MNKTIWAVLAVLAVFLASYFGGRVKGCETGRKQGYAQGYKAGYNTPHPADTIIRVDTFIINHPVPVEREVVRTDTLYVNDTLYVQVPIEAVMFGGQPGDEYKALVSGWRPAIEWIEVYPRTQIVNNYIDRPVPVEKPVPYTWTLSAVADAQATKGWYQARAGLLYERQISGPLRWKAGGGYAVSNQGRGPYLETGLELTIIHNRR